MRNQPKNARILKTTTGRSHVPFLFSISEALTVDAMLTIWCHWGICVDDQTERNIIAPAPFLPQSWKIRKWRMGSSNGKHLSNTVFSICMKMGERVTAWKLLHKFHFANFFTRCGEPHVCQAMFQSMATQARKRCIRLWWIFWMIHRTTSDASYKYVQVIYFSMNKTWLVQWSRLPNITHSLPSWKHWWNTIEDYEVGGNPDQGFIKKFEVRVYM